MGWVIFFVFVGFVIWGIQSSAALNGAKRAHRDAFLGSHEGWDAYVTPTLDQVIAIDHDGRRIAIGPLASPIEVAWADISSCEVERNGQSITATNRGSQAMGAAVGGLLLGPAGLLLGGLSGSKRNVQKVNELSLKVTIDNRASPLHRIIFLKIPGDGLKPENALIKQVAERLEHFHALLSNAIRNEDRSRISSPIQSPSLEGPSGQLERLWSLHQDGALTAEEYASAKARLLGDGAPRLG